MDNPANYWYLRVENGIIRFSSLEQKERWIATANEWWAEMPEIYPMSDLNKELEDASLPELNEGLE